MNIKGNACIQMINYLKESYPAAQIDKLKMALDDQPRTLIERRILASSWVDHEHYMKILLAADRILGKSDLELIRQCGAYQAQKEINGLYRVLISLVSPKTVINSALKLYKQVYDKGKVTVVKSASHNVVYRVDGQPDVPLYHDIDCSSVLAELLRMAGAKKRKISSPQVHGTRRRPLFI